MRKKITNRILLLFFITIFIFAFLFLQEKLNHLITQRQINQPLAKINKNQITKIVFEDENQKTEVYKKNNHWYLKQDNFEFRANEERIKNTIEVLVNLKKEEIISQNKNKYKDFGIDKRRVTFYIDKDKFRVYVGNSANFTHNFVRIEDDDSVFLAENVNDIFSNTDWRDLRVNLISNLDKIKSIGINYLNEEKKLILVKDKNGWQVNGKKAKKDRVDFFINDLINLKAEDINYQENFYYINPEVTVVINEGNQINKGDFFTTDTDQEYYLLKTNKDNFIYKIKSLYISFLKKEEGDFIQ